MFDLTITFAGLCLLARDPDRGMLHVLMPFPTGNPHFARLIFVDPAGQVRKEEIAGMDLEMPGLTGSNGFDSAVHSDVFDFGSPLLGSRKVRKDLLDPSSPPPNPPVRTRMRLTAGRSGLAPRRGGWWNFDLATGTVPRRLPTALDWVVHDVDLTHLVIEDKVGGSTFQVHPDSNGAIHVLIVHVTAEELEVIGPTIPVHSRCPDDKHEAKHFGLYGDLLDPAGVATLPKFDRPRSHASGLCATPLLDARQALHAHAETAAVTAAAAATAAVTASSGVPATPAATAAAAAAAAAAASAALRAAAAAAGGSLLTCMVTTAPAA